MQHDPAEALATSTPSPTLRPQLEALLGRLARGYVQSLRPMERVMVESLSRARGWDLDHLASGRGPLSPVSDFGLAVLVRVFAEELNAVDLAGLAGAYPAAPPPALVDAALGELREAMG